MARPFIPWVGGKEKLLAYILQILPPCIRQYLEPFGGSGAVLLSLSPSSKRLDIYNDLNSDLVNLFLCVKEKTNVLMRELGWLAFPSRQVFERYKRFLEHKDVYYQNIREEIEVLSDRNCFTEEQAAELLPIFQRRAELFDVQRAVAFCTQVWGSFNGTTSSFGVKRLGIDRAIRRIQEAALRLKDVVIENKNAIEIIQDEDCENGAIYCDPPYYQAEKSYTEVFTERDHVELCEVLKKCKGYVIVSYNDCPFIRKLYKDFFIMAFARHNSMSHKKGTQYKELLITNYDPRQFVSQLDLFDGTGNMHLIHIPKKPLKI